MASKKNELKEAKQEQHIIELRLMGHTWLDIESKTKIPHSTAVRIFNKAMTARAKEQSKQKMQAYIQQEDQRIMLLIKEAYQAFQDSKGVKQETTQDKGTTEKGDYEKAKVVQWRDAGDPRFIQVIKELMIERNRLHGVYDKDREDDDKTEVVRFEQNVYIPGLGAITPEMMNVLIANFEAKHAGG